MESRFLEWSIAAGAAAAGVAIFFVGLGRQIRWREVNQRVRTFVVPEHATLSDGADVPAVAVLPEPGGALNRRFAGSALGASLQARLTRASASLKPAEFVALQVFGAILAAVAGYFIAPRASGVLGELVFTLILGLAGFVTPLLVLTLQERTRLSRFERQLPRAIDAMAGTLQAGSTLPQAMEVIAREMPPPISVEFRRVLREVELGLSFVESLESLTSRLPSHDLLLLTSAISIQSRVGGDLADILLRISHTIRERLRIRSELNVLTAQGRYSSYIITGLPVVLFFYLYFYRYDYVSQLFLPGITRVLLFGGIAGIAVGFYMMRKIVTVDA